MSSLATPDTASQPRRSLWRRCVIWLTTQQAPSLFHYLSDPADIRASELLKANLSLARRQQYDLRGSFEVVGGSSGTVYRICYGSQMNVQVLDDRRKGTHWLCFVPDGNLPVSDVLLAQKFALELFEADTLALANKLPGYFHR